MYEKKNCLRLETMQALPKKHHGRKNRRKSNRVMSKGLLVIIRDGGYSNLSFKCRNICLKKYTYIGIVRNCMNPIRTNNDAAQATLYLNW